MKQKACNKHNCQLIFALLIYNNIAKFLKESHVASHVFDMQCIFLQLFCSHS